MVTPCRTILFVVVFVSGQPASEGQGVLRQIREPTAMEQDMRTSFKPFLLKDTDFGSKRIDKFKESQRNSAFPTGRGSALPEYQQEIFLQDGSFCVIHYRLVNTEAAASELIQSHVSDVAETSRKIEQPQTLGLEGAKDLYVFKTPFTTEGVATSAGLIFRYRRLYVHVGVVKDTTGNAEQMRDSLAQKVLARAKVVFGPGNEIDVKAVRPVELTPVASYEPFLLKEAQFGDVREFKARVVLRRVLERSLPRQRQVCIQEAFAPNGELCIVEYLLCESPLEACAVMFHRALSVAEPGRLLVVDDSGQYSKTVQAIGGSKAVDDVYVFVGAKAGSAASMMVRRDRLLVQIEVLNDPENRAEETRDTLARLVLAQANEAMR